jgi:hypothetical protein
LRENVQLLEQKKLNYNKNSEQTFLYKMLSRIE